MKTPIHKNMSFLLKPMPYDKDYDSKNIEYHKFLSENKNNIDQSFFKYFGINDFFHDSTVEYSHYDFVADTFSLKLSCPNFSYKNNTESCNIDFDINFYGVSSFQIYSIHSVDLEDCQQSNAIVTKKEFLCSEIDTLIDIASDKCFEESIIMILSADNKKYTISLIFSWCEIMPSEPLAYQMLINSGVIVQE